ncbi:unnamed protein product [Phytophthora fragariaefolia]|uniref:Unnamed protein product n=1 Tax=Phytophthora fragariaefolia TaxID=1490495 RepID=A0A9W6TKA6_9STRA|nr:unnamed protein product [Phytophthora fragariaefolia]
MRENKLYANLKKCIFCAPEIPVLGCYVSRNGVRADSETISSICSWPTPKNQTELRQWLGLANYLHKYTKDYAALIQPMSSLLKKEVAWDWCPEHQDAFDAVKKGLATAPVLMLPDTSRPCHVVCNISDFAIGCALMQFDAEGREPVVSINHDSLSGEELPRPWQGTPRYALRSDQVHSVPPRRADVRSYNFVVHYKPGKNYILANALSRRPDYDPRRLTRHQDIPDDDDDEACCATCLTLCINAIVSSPVLPLRQQIADAYEEDAFYTATVRYLRNPTADTPANLTRTTRDTTKRYDLDGDLLTYTVDTFDPPRVIIPADASRRARLLLPADGRVRVEQRNPRVDGSDTVLRGQREAPHVPVLLVVRSPHAAPGSTLGWGGRAPTSQSVQESSEPPLPQSATSSAQDTTVEGHALHGVAYEESLAVNAAALAASIVANANFAPKPTPTPIDSAAASELLLHRQAVTRFVRDALQFLLLIARRTMRIDGVGRTCRPSDGANGSSYPRTTSKARL